jgi:hypothetical protein
LPAGRPAGPAVIKEPAGHARRERLEPRACKGHQARGGARGAAGLGWPLRRRRAPRGARRARPRRARGARPHHKRALNPDARPIRAGSPAMAPKKGAKASKKGPDHGAEPDPGELLALIDQTGDLPLESRLQLLHTSPEPCPAGCKGGRKDNPACLCGLIPEEGRFKKAGLFTKLPAALGELGVDPSTQRRPVRVLCAARAAPCRAARPRARARRARGGPLAAWARSAGPAAPNAAPPRHTRPPAPPPPRAPASRPRTPPPSRPRTTPLPARAQDPGRPAGLRNLGNTCYVNASLQMLHNIGLFRDALLKLEPQIAGQDVVAQMRCGGAREGAGDGPGRWEAWGGRRRSEGPAAGPAEGRRWGPGAGRPRGRLPPVPRPPAGLHPPRPTRPPAPPPPPPTCPLKQGPLPFPGVRSPLLCGPHRVRQEPAAGPLLPAGADRDGSSRGRCSLQAPQAAAGPLQTNCAPRQPRSHRPSADAPPSTPCAPDPPGRLRVPQAAAAEAGARVRGVQPEGGWGGGGGARG